MQESITGRLILVMDICIHRDDIDGISLYTPWPKDSYMRRRDYTCENAETTYPAMFTDRWDFGGSWTIRRGGRGLSSSMCYQMGVY